MACIILFKQVNGFHDRKTRKRVRATYDDCTHLQRVCWVVLHIQSTKLCTKLIRIPPCIGLLSHCDQLPLLCGGHGVLATSDCIGILLVGLVKVSVLHSFDLLAGELCGMAYHLNRSNGRHSC